MSGGATNAQIAAFLTALRMKGETAEEIAGFASVMRDYATRVEAGDDVKGMLAKLKPEVALYVGGMGAREKNFYNDYAKRMGFEDAAVKIQDAFLGGRRNEAMAAVPDAFIDQTALVGPPDRIQARVKEWKAIAKGNKIGSMLLGAADVAALRVIAEAAA